MTKFLNGPAAGVTLMLKRAPYFLRVVHSSGTREWDALDQIGDQAEPHEQLIAYYLSENKGCVHLRMARRKGCNPSGWYAIANYRVCMNQPPEEVMRCEASWQGWATAEFRKRSGEPV